jgi:hypothetical protein
VVASWRPSRSVETDPKCQRWVIGSGDNLQRLTGSDRGKFSQVSVEKRHEHGQICRILDTVVTEAANWGVAMEWMT